MKNELPEGWKTFKIEDIASVNSGQGAPQGEKYYNGKNTFVKAGDLNKLTDQKYVGDYCLKVTDNAINEYKLRLFPRNSILFPKSGMSVMTDNIALLKHDSYVVNHLAILEILDLSICDPIYLYYYLKRVKISNISLNESYPSIRLTDISRFKVTLPPLETQKKIVEILEKAEKLKELRAEADELADELFNSYFLEMFGDPIKNKKEFETDLLKNLCELKSGGTPSRKNSEYFEGNIPWITTVALGPKFIGYDDAVEYITEESINKSATKLIPANSIIFGTRVGVGKASINKCDICTNQDITSVVNLDKRLNIDFLLQVFKYYEKYFESQVRGATIKGITSKTLKELTIIIPPITLQNQFAQIVQQVEKLKTHQSQSKQEIDNLFNTLMQKAFKGELVC